MGIHDEDFNFTGFIAFLLVMSGCVAMVYGLTLWTDRSLDFVVSQLADKPVDVPTWLSFLVTIILNGFIVVGNVIVEIIRLIMGV